MTQEQFDKFIGSIRGLEYLIALSDEYEGGLTVREALDKAKERLIGK